MTEGKLPGAFSTEDVWIVVGNANGWGKGHTLREALGNMFKETGYSHKVTECIVYRWLNVPEERVKDYYCDGFGTTRSPVLDPPIESKRLHVKDGATLAKLQKAFWGFTDEVEAFEYSGDMSRTFD